MKINHIAIEREYGSGGTKIARMLSKVSGVPCYGQEILEKVSEKQGVSVDRIQQYEESVKGNFLYSLFALGTVTGNTSDLVTPEGHVFIAEQEVIKDFARKGKSIFLGHCAFEALKDRTDVIKIYIRCSDENEKKKRIINDYGIAESEVETIRKRYDKKRANYYHAYTAERWNDLTRYDLVLDTAKIGIEESVNMLKGIYLSDNTGNKEKSLQ